MTDAGTRPATLLRRRRSASRRAARARALEPEYVPEPKRPSRRARHPLVIAGNAIFTIILVVAIAGGLAYSFGKQQARGAGSARPREDRQHSARARPARDRRSARARERHRPAVGVHRRRAGAQGARRSEIRRIQVRQAGHACARRSRRSSRARWCSTPFTIPEGLTSEQIVARLAEVDFLAGNIREIPKEGTLLPETYNFPRGTTREQAIQRMQQAHAPRAARRSGSGATPICRSRSPEALVTLASIVEKETGTAGRALARRRGVRQPAAPAHEAAIRSDHHLRAGRRQGHARPPDHALRDRRSRRRTTPM